MTFVLTILGLALGATTLSFLGIWLVLGSERRVYAQHIKALDTDRD